VTEIGQSTPPPGYYPDPDGAPGLVRWWNGVSWSDVAVPAGPGVTVAAPQPAHARVAPPFPQDSVVPPPAAPPSPGSGARTGWIVALSIVGVVIAVVAGLLFFREPDVQVDPPQVGGQSSPGGPTFPPGTVRIIDEAAGISYPFLGDGWYEFDLGLQLEVTSIAGQYFTTQEQLPDSSGMFIAQCTSGPLAEGYGWAGPGSLQTTVATVADSVRGNYYPGPNERTVLRDEAREVDGHAAHLFEFQLAWDIEGYDSTGERAALLLIDVGRPAPALLYISIPNTHAELYGVIDRVLNDVDVL
jgi:hypothetical protein